MLKKDITYKTLDGETVTETFYFNLTKADLVELQLSEQGGLQEHLARIVAAEDGKAIIAEFKKILQMSYGQKSPDGKRFIKNDQLWEDFRGTEAYSELFMELVTDADAAARFINAVIPQDMVEPQVEELRTVHPQTAEALATPIRLTEAEAETMDKSELYDGLKNGRYIIA